MLGFGHALMEGWWLSLSVQGLALERLGFYGLHVSDLHEKQIPIGILSTTAHMYLEGLG